jgi:ADP-ribose pyrophosphatase YjhB (NUDIX family)
VVTATRLDWARRLQAIAQSGLAWKPGEYDQERYEQVRRIAAEMLASPDGVSPERIEGLLAGEVGHATPKLDVRGVVFWGDAILLVQERADRKWTLPGGWVDVGESPSEAVVREIREESGFATRAVKLLALYDRDRHGHPPHLWHIWKAFFLCELVGDDQDELGAETVAAAFFPRDSLPELAYDKVTREYVERFFEHRDHPEWPADFD